MAFIRNNNLRVGDTVILNRNFTSHAGTFERGTEVTITECGNRGFSVTDKDGNTMVEMGFDIGKKKEGV